MWTEGRATQESVVHFRNAFTLKASFLCVLRKSVLQPVVGQVPTCFIGLLVYVLRGNNHPNQGMSLKCV
jgi:hypothetical protein